MERITSIQQLELLKNSLQKAKESGRNVVRVCLGPGCRAQGADKVAAAFRDTVRQQGLPVKIEPLIKETGCHGFCKEGPLVTLVPSGLFYSRVKPEDVEEIVEKTIKKQEVISRLLYSENGTSYRTANEIPFYKRQMKLASRNVGDIDPLNIEDAIANDAYQAAAKAFSSMSPDQVIKEVEISGLRGRGGAGFPTGRKWRSASNAVKKRPGPVYVVCNGDEGDPGAFMDCAIMEGDPHSVIEGMIIAAYALDARQGFIYVREEYPFAIRNLTIAMDQARSVGLLGKNIMGSGFDFDIRINRGAGAYVCGESTALFLSIEGKPGEPRAKYIRSVERGLWDRPTVLNNVETWANIPVIIEKGGEWFSKIGVPGSTGTKAFSLVGKVKNVGLVEVPMGVPLSTIVEEIGGGIPGKGAFKAVQTGGPSGGCIPYKLKDVSVDYDSLTKIGSIMGSGGMIVMDDKDCVVDVARYFLRFLEEESCGKCLPCRLGLEAMLEFLDNFTQGKGSLEDIEELKSLAKAVQDGALCALGGSAPNPMLTTLEYFREEYEAHIVDKRCPAGVCKALITYHIDPEACTGCGLCAGICPQSCITGEEKSPHKIVQNACNRCGLCMDLCKFSAITVS
ncbi:NADH dehydrogenase (Quinone) [uncultured Desulfobacterium sp.]|uniref:NADH dehydrogenase (Quinone) n=1 Tax=uncultured Desulfobacterium sp. TaxID=201089 RepID=A0A445MQY0_9BACT|nr:NADH dehydrogenase (Quinone) [uncultured Desulfobacterium sp.]